MLYEVITDIFLGLGNSGAIFQMTGMQLEAEVEQFLVQLLV